MNAILLATLSSGSYTPVGMCAVGIVVFVIGLLRSKGDIARARGVDKVVALASVCVAVPFGMFGALHLFGARFVVDLVPPYMPWHLFWAYGIGVALVVAALSIAAGIAVRWSGLLVGVLMFLFVAMIHLPGALRHPDETRLWIIVCRELSFGGAGWILAGRAWNGTNESAGRILTTVGRWLITIALVFFGVEHFLHPTVLPGVPLEKEMPAGIPARQLIDYVTGAALLMAGGSVVLSRKTRSVTGWVGGWLLTLILVLYLPLMISALSDPGMGVKLQGVNYFADTLLFAGVVLALASASSDQPASARDRN